MIASTPPAGPLNYLTFQASVATPLDALDAAAVVEPFRENGAILFRGFDYDVQSLTRFTGRFCSRFVRNESGRRGRVSGDGTTQTVNLGHEAFPLHPELSRVPWRPDIACFACAGAPTSGGETLICDGADIAARLSPATRNLVANRRLLYREETPMGAFTDWLGIPPPDDQVLALISRDSPFRFERSGGRIFRSFTRPFLDRGLFTEAPVFANFLLFARYMLKTRQFPTFEDGSLIPEAVAQEIKEVSDGLTVAHRWQRGDLLMLDNSRFLHGRNPVENVEERQIWTQFGYAGFLDDDDERLAQPWRYTDDPLFIFFGPGALDLRDRASGRTPSPAGRVS
jgi:alpha-ketoglutarate-dependent taurine dioxygenase